MRVSRQYPHLPLPTCAIREPILLYRYGIGRSQYRSNIPGKLGRGVAGAVIIRYTAAPTIANAIIAGTNAAMKFTKVSSCSLTYRVDQRRSSKILLDISRK